jgi:hypothetical protein
MFLLSFVLAKTATTVSSPVQQLVKWFDTLIISASYKTN